MTLLSVGPKTHDGRRDAVYLPSNLKSIRVGKDRERDAGFPYSEAVVCIGGWEPGIADGSQIADAMH